MRFFKYILAFLGFFAIFGGIYYVYANLNQTNDITRKLPNTLNGEKNDETDTTSSNSPFAKSDIVSVALLGVDRRSKAEGFRTDIMIVVALNKKTNQVVMASVPRDLWWDGGRINATYIQSGWPALQEGLSAITGVKPEKFILTDFQDFKWVVDAMGGVPVNIETTFTDSQYPVDETFEYQTVSFNQGPETLTGERALIFSRSRKGDNDNGDWGRMKRQHLILKGMLTAVTQPSSMFKNMKPEEMLKVATNSRMDTNLDPTDVVYLWDLYKDKDKYKATSLYLDYDYLFTPPMSEYGGAWVLAPINDTFEPFQQRFKDALAGVEPQPATVPTTQTPEEVATQ